MDEETSTENDTISTVSCTPSLLNLASKSDLINSPLFGTPKSKWHAKSGLTLKKCKSVKLE